MLVYIPPRCVLVSLPGYRSKGRHMRVTKKEDDGFVCVEQLFGLLIFRSLLPIGQN